MKIPPCLRCANVTAAPVTERLVPEGWHRKARSGYRVTTPCNCNRYACSTPVGSYACTERRKWRVVDGEHGRWTSWQPHLAVVTFALEIAL